MLRNTRARGSLVQGVTACPQHIVRICARSSASSLHNRLLQHANTYEAAGGPSAVRVSRAGAECVPAIADAGGRGYVYHLLPSSPQ